MTFRMAIFSPVGALAISSSMERSDSVTDPAPNSIHSIREPDAVISGRSCASGSAGGPGNRIRPKG